MQCSARTLSPSEAAERLGVSAKALRLYEQRELLHPIRTEAGWRVYGPNEMARAAQIVAFRALGFSLAQIARVLDGNPEGLEAALAAHQATLEDQARACSLAVERVRTMRDELSHGQRPTLDVLAELGEPLVSFDLPWPWGGEPFELRSMGAVNFIVGPLGSGKTRFAHRLAEKLPGATFLGLDRLTNAGAALDATLERWLVEDGASPSDALRVLLVSLQDGAGILVVDMIEQGLDEATQRALVAFLRRRGRSARPVFLLTRSNAILDLPDTGRDEAIIFCPANHDCPTLVAPYPGSPGYEAVATCLASPTVRARTEGMIAWLPAARHE